MIKSRSLRALVLIAIATMLAPTHARNVDKDLLDILLQNGSITQEQHADLLTKLQEEDVQEPADDTAPATPIVTETALEEKIAEQVALQVEEVSPIKASYTSKGFRFETRDGNWQTNLQWRAQMRYTNPFSGDPRQLSNFDSPDQSTFENRRLRMKIGGHGYRPWLKYYFEVDLQPTRDTDDSSSLSLIHI